MKVKLSDICDIVKGKTTITKAIEGEYPLVVTGENRLSNSEFQFDCSAVCVPLVSATGHGHASIKRIHYQEGKFALGSILAAVIPKSTDEVNPRYLHIYLSYFKDSVLVPLMRGSANVSLTIKSLGSAEIELPSIDKQLEIVRVVSKVEKMKNEMDKYLINQGDIVLNMKKEILQLAVQGKLVPQDPNDEPAEVLLERIREEKERLLKEKKIKKEKYNSNINIEDIIYQIPNGWEHVRLADISSVITKQTGFDYTNHIKPNLIEQKREGYIPMIQTKNFKGSKFNYNTDYYLPMEIASKFPKIILKDKSLLFSIVGASIGNVGKYDSEKKCIIGGAICKVDLINNIFMDYLYYFLQSPSGQYEIKKNYKSTAQGTITVQDVREIVINMPPLAEQKRIVEKLDLLMRIEKQKQYSDKLMESILKSSLLS